MVSFWLSSVKRSLMSSL
uniref:Uncharacterized protein n=1 Tax=Arundo donax TaxID=35708 RepID=A0A0A8YM52_ARUDO